MANNLAVTEGAGKTVATDEVSTVHYQKIKLDAGGNGVSVPVIAGSQSDSASLPVALSTESKALLGSLTETAPSTDTASSGLNGRLQRIAQRLTTLITNVGTLVFGAGTASAAQRVTLASDDPAVSALGATSGAKVITDANGTIQQYLRGIVYYILTYFLPRFDPANYVKGLTSAMTGTTSTLLLSAPGASLYNYITEIAVSNSHATVGTDIELQDGSGGTTFWVLPAAAVYGGAVIHFDPPLKQPTSNTALYVKNATTGASTRVSVNGYKGA